MSSFQFQSTEFTRNLQRNLGDRLVGMVTQGISWATPREYQYKLDYPENSDGTVITYVQVIAQQVSQGKIFSGLLLKIEN